MIALRGLLPDSPGAAVDLDLAVELAEALGARYDCRLAAGDTRGASDDLDEAVALLSGAAARAAAASHLPGALGVQTLLGLALADRFALRAAAAHSVAGPLAPDAVAAARADRDAAIGVLGAALAGGPADPQDRALLADVLGQLRYDRHNDPWPAAAAVPGDLDAAVSLLSIAAGHGEPERQTLEYLVLALSDRCVAAEDIADREALIRQGERLLALPGGDDDRAVFHHLVATALLDLAEAGPDAGAGAERPGRQAALSAAIGHLQAALADTQAVAARAELAALLAQACWRRLDGDAGDHAGVDLMTGYAQEAWRLLPPDDDARPLIAVYLASGVHERLCRPGEEFDFAAVGQAVEALTQAEPHARADPDIHATVVVMLGHFLAARGQVAGSAADLAAAQPWLLRAASEIRPEDPRWADVTQTLASAMTVLAGLGMSADRLDQAIGLLAVAAGRPGAEPDRAALIREALGAMLVQRAAYTGSDRDIDDGVGHLRAAWELTAQGHIGRIALASNLASALLIRYSHRGDTQDLDAAGFYLAVARDLAETHRDICSLVADVDAVLLGIGGLLALARGLAGDRSAFDEAVTSLRAAVDSLGEGHPYQPRLRGDLAYALMTRAGQGGRPDVEAREAMAHMRAITRDLPSGNLMHPIVMLRAGLMLVASGLADHDPAPVREAVRSLARARAELDPRFGERVRFHAALGGANQALHQLTGEPAALREAIGWLEEARRDLDGLPGHSQRIPILTLLGQCHRAAGDAAAARRTGLLALRERGRDVLLQSGTSRALAVARLAAPAAAEVATWCLDDGEPGQAVTALELGRGLILHAATASADVPAMLTEAGRADLAVEWRAATAADHHAPPWDLALDVAGYGGELLSGSASLQIPDDLRARVLAALAGGEAEERLLAPPTSGEIAAALGALDADALVYLIAPPGQAAGKAVIVRASAGTGATLEVLGLPLLDDGPGGPLAEYAAAYAAMAGDSGDEAREGAPAAQRGQERWRRSLEALCDWAHPAAMSPLLDHIRQWGLGRLPRVVLAPVGRLSLVPWHAARREGGGVTRRYALAEAVISYSASGRQLIETSLRPALPPSAAPVIVGNPGLNLVFAGLEALAIREACYPSGRYLGAAVTAWGQSADGPGRAAEVLAGLPSEDGPGASVLHLGCHATVVPAAPGRSYLKLAHGDQLTIEAILRQARGRSRDAPGGLVSLAACMSDLGGPEHDEALTLATAFLAAGAASVVGARWNVPDGATSLLLFMFHHFFAVEGRSAGEALRLAQLWMIDPGRTPPRRLPGTLAGQLAVPPDLAAWAAFAHRGR